MGIENMGAAFALVFVAELGDKTQLAVMAMSARYSARRVLLGAMAAFALLNVVAVAAGKLLSDVLDPFWVAASAGALFIFFGLWALKAGDDDGDEVVAQKSGNSILWLSFTMIFLAELGDKTQLATAGLAARLDSPLEVFIGSTLALWGVSALGALLGKKVLGRLPGRAVRLASAALFILFGVAFLLSLLKW
jgi:putative Ca2+/H+ antiporter (TMEM165/GDT1 family)